MAKRSQAFALMLLLITLLAPAQLAVAAGNSVEYARHPAVLHQDDDGEHESEDESEDEDEDEDEDDDGKQFAPPPLVVKHKSLTETSKDSKPTVNSTNKAGKGSSLLQGVVPSSDEVLLRAAGLGIVSLEQAFATNEYVTSAVPPKGSQEGDRGGIPGRSPEELDPMLNEPVVNQLGSTSYQDPATEFIHKAYFGLAVLGAGAVGMAAHTISKTRRAAHANDQDYDYEGQN